MSVPKSHHNQSYAVDYLRNTTPGHDKFYRLGVFEIEDDWYTVYNWGPGGANGDCEWMTGQIKIETFRDHGLALNAAVLKTREKKTRGYVYENALAAKAYPGDQAVPQRVYDAVTGTRMAKINSATGQPKTPKPKAPATISIHTKDGVLKPALAKRVKWNAP